MQCAYYDCSSTSTKLLKNFAASAICNYIDDNHYIDHGEYIIMIGYVRLHLLIGNNSSQSVHVIIVIQDTSAMTARGNRGRDKGPHQKEQRQKQRR